MIESFERGAFNEFERHSRVGMVTEEGFAERVKELRKAGAKYVFLKTGAYRPPTWLAPSPSLPNTAWIS